MGDEQVEGAEIIGYDPERTAYVTQYFGNDGLASYEAELAEEDGSLSWRMRSDTTRFAGTFSDDAAVSPGSGSCWTTTETGSPGWTSP